MRPGNTYLKTALVEAAQAAAHSRGTYLRDKFFRLKARRGYKRALIAIAHKILIAVYHMLSTGASYKELCASYLDQRSKPHVTQNLVRRLERSGYAVTIAPKVA